MLRAAFGLFLAALLWLPASNAQAADAAAGETVFKRFCTACHIATAEGRRGVGPTLFGVVGQIPGRVHLVRELADIDALDVADAGNVAFVSQTTLSVDETRDIAAALRRRFPAIVGPDTKDICYATQNRQTAVRELARRCDAVVVIGAANSSNSNRLRELAAESGTPSVLLEDSRALDWNWLAGVNTLGVTAGASAPEKLVAELLETIAARMPVDIEALDGIEESIRFRLPAEVA